MQHRKIAAKIACTSLKVHLFTLESKNEPGLQGRHWLTAYCPSSMLGYSWLTVGGAYGGLRAGGSRLTGCTQNALC